MLAVCGPSHSRCLVYWLHIVQSRTKGRRLEQRLSWSLFELNRQLKPVFELAILSIIQATGLEPISPALDRSGRWAGASTSAAEARAARVARLKARAIAIDSVGNKNTGAHDAKECGDSFKHGL
jgi:hypothetical protein